MYSFVVVLGDDVVVLFVELSVIFVVDGIGFGFDEFVELVFGGGDVSFMF